MDSQAVRRRMNMIVGHFAGNEDVSPTHIFPLNCSSTMNSVIRRCDNRMLFARQGSISQACFMRQAAIKGNPGHVNNSYQSAVPPFSSGCTNEGSSCYTSEPPLFSRPSPQMKPQYSPMKPDCDLSKTQQPPTFSRPNRGLGDHKQIFSDKRSHEGTTELSPRMVVRESNYNYVMTIELHGVHINNIRVEVDDQNLIVTGKSPTQWWRVACESEDFISRHQNREVQQGPYHVVWPLPSDVNKDGVSAEFVYRNGLLKLLR